MADIKKMHFKYHAIIIFTSHSNAACIIVKVQTFRLLLLVKVENYKNHKLLLSKQKRNKHGMSAQSLECFMIVFIFIDILFFSSFILLYTSYFFNIFVIALFIRKRKHETQTLIAHIPNMFYFMNYLWEKVRKYLRGTLHTPQAGTSRKVQ